METIFLFLYDFFKTRRALLFSLLTLLLGAFALLASRITIEEDISKFFPVDKKLEKVNQALQGSRFAEKLVMMVSLKDSTQVNSDALIEYTDSLVVRIQKQISQYVKDVNYQVDDQLMVQMLGVVQQNLPIFLTEDDYSVLDTMTLPNSIHSTMERNYHQLISPTGLATKRIIVKDPVGITNIVLKKLQSLQVNDEFELYDNHYFTKNHRYLLFFITPAYPANDTGNNSKFLSALENVIQQLSETTNPQVASQYFGAVAVAAGNAVQLRADTILTLSITIVLLIAFLFGFLRKLAAPFLIFIPVVFGAMFSLAMVYLIQGNISVLAIAAGSIILGIAINYSLHFFSHLKETGDVRSVVKDVVEPMTIGSATTVLAFLSLQFANASLLSDLGLFAGFSLIGAAFCSLVFLPHLLNNNFFGTQSHKAWQFNFIFLQPRHTRYLIPLVLLLTPVMLYFANDVRFNSDMTKLNFMNNELKQTEKLLNRITNLSAQSVFVVTDGKNLEEALRTNESVIGQLESLRQLGTVKKYASVSSFLISDSLQQKRIERWNHYWTAEKKNSVMKILEQEAHRLKFSQIAVSNFDQLISQSYSPATIEDLKLIQDNLFSDYITTKNGVTTVVTTASIDPAKNSLFYKVFENQEHTQPFDKRMLTNMFVSFVHADFTYIVTVTSALVFFVLLISYGRIELTLIAFIPMLITWIWILGAMALLGIEFNIINVMVSTFIFGLGDDYSIFVMDGLLKEYRTGQKVLPSVQDSIFLSAITTISGLGVLILAKHPALKSIAAISIIGILMVWIMSQTLAPFIFKKIIANRAKKKLPPTTLVVFLFTWSIYFVFVSGAIILTIIGFFQFKVLRLNGPRSKYFYHKLIKFFTGIPIYMGLHTGKKIINRDVAYHKPMVIICNHQSFIDILVTCMLSPKVVLLTNNWVWNSPIFGWIVKMADFYPVDFGVEASVEKLRPVVEQGYSIVVFPEGTRSEDGNIKRFHKGAFYLAEQLKIDILPLFLYGNGDSIRKGDFNIGYSTFIMWFQKSIAYDDASFGNSYSEKAKRIGQYFRTEYQRASTEVLTPYYYRDQLISNYLYKGPVLEWYLRIKLRLEDYYEPFHKLIPLNAKVLDLGCGYGFLSYMLQLLSPDREITGVDYDEDKIAVAQHGYKRSEKLNFIHADITAFDFEPHDAIVISDVLHYLNPEQQQRVLQRCLERLKPGGVIILRDGDRDLKEKHGNTRLTELFSIKLLKFNKSEQPLHFISGTKISEWATISGLQVERVSNQKFTSNVIFALRKPSDESNKRA